MELIIYSAVSVRTYLQQGISARDEMGGFRIRLNNGENAVTSIIMDDFRGEYDELMSVG